MACMTAVAMVGLVFQCQVYGFGRRLGAGSIVA